jgi:hypothetical protein
MKMPISTDATSGSSRMQPQYDESPLYGALWEVHDADWPTEPPSGDRERLIRALEVRWERWRKAKDAINADIRRAYLARLEEVGREIDADRQKQMRDDLDAQHAVYAAADTAENQRYLDAIYAAKQKKDAAWLATARARLGRATKSMNADLVSAERKHFAERGLLRGMRR